jgi:hypothetical protein
VTPRVYIDAVETMRRPERLQARRRSTGMPRPPPRSSARILSHDYKQHSGNHVHGQRRKNPGKPILDEGLPRIKTAVDELPPPDTGRWTVRRKAAVVEAVLSGVISVEEVCRRYDLSVEEFLSWHYTMKMHGIRGLRTTMLQRYRPSRAKGD